MNGAYRADYIIDGLVAFTLFGGPFQIPFQDTTSESGSYSIEDSNLIFAHDGVSDTVGFSGFPDSLRIIQDVPLGEFTAIAASIDPEAGPPLAVLTLVRVDDAQVGSADFDNSGQVDFVDFLGFAAHFGLGQADAGFESRFDLDGDGSVGFLDFLAFAKQFGT